MIVVQIFTDPAEKPHAWAAPKHCKTHSYDPKSKEKEQTRWQIRSQYVDEPLCGALHLDFTFNFPIPKSTSSIRRRQMLCGILVPIVKPDTSNMTKFYEDCLKGIVIVDDNIVTDISSRKRYSNRPGVIIMINSLLQNNGVCNLN